MNAVGDTAEFHTEPQGLHMLSRQLRMRNLLWIMSLPEDSNYQILVSGSNCNFKKKIGQLFTEVFKVVRQLSKPVWVHAVVPEKNLPFWNETCSIGFFYQQQVFYSEQAFFPDRHECSQQASIYEKLFYIYKDWRTNHTNLHLDSGTSTPNVLVQPPKTSAGHACLKLIFHYLLSHTTCFIIN